MHNDDRLHKQQLITYDMGCMNARREVFSSSLALLLVGGLNDRQRGSSPDPMQPRCCLFGP